MRFYDFLAVLFKGAQVDKTLGNIFMTNVIMRQLSHLNEEKKREMCSYFCDQCDYISITQMKVIKHLLKKNEILLYC